MHQPWKAMVRKATKLTMGNAGAEIQAWNLPCHALKPGEQLLCFALSDSVHSLWSVCVLSFSCVGLFGKLFGKKLLRLVLNAKDSS